MKNYQFLIEKAKAAQRNSYAPYSLFNVGAALLTRDGEVYTGCNIENASYGATICAERVAFGNAINDSERDFAAIAIVGGKGFTSECEAIPCGVCLQVMSEFCGENFEIVLCKGEEIKIYKLSELLPHRFNL